MAKQGITRKLKGYYTINAKGQIYCIDFIKNYKEDVRTKKSTFKKKRRLSSVTRKKSQHVIGDEENRLFASELIVEKKRSETSVDSDIEEEETDSPAGFGVKPGHGSIQKIDDDILPAKLKGKDLQVVTKGKQLEGFTPVEEVKPDAPSGNRPEKGQVLDLIDEAEESEEDDEELVMDAMIGEYLMEQYASISGEQGIGSFIQRRNDS
jgi:hypothetical protein